MQRVAIGRALVRRPKALLMDEPIGALDAKLREDMRAELKRLHIENGTTSVYVTHDQVEAMSLADRVAVMNDGVLQQVGTPSEVYLHPVNLFVAQFVGSPVMNIMPAEIRAEGGRDRRCRSAAGQAFGFPGDLAAAARRGAAGGARAGASGVRPEAVKVAREAGPGLRPVEAQFIEPLGAYDIVDLKVGERLPQGAHPERLRARRRARRSGRGSTRRRCISSTPPPATSWTLGLGAWLRSGSTASASASAASQALDDLTLTIADGEFFVLLGPTGAGKTTTLRLIAGLEKPDAGHVSIGGEDTAGWSVAQRDVALVFQYYSLYPRYTVRQNLAFPLQVAGAQLLRRRDRARASRGRRRCCASSTCSTARPTGSPAARCSASRSAAPSCATRASS